MKQIKNNLLLIFAVLLILFNSCKNNNDVSTPVTTMDLVDYYIVFQTNKNSYKVIYFVNENNKINAYYDGFGVRQIISSETVTDNILKLEYSFNNQTADFTFNLNKDSKGDITLNSYSSDYSEYSIIHAEVYKNSDAPVFLKSNATDMIFKYTKASDGDALFLYFNQFSTGYDWKYDDKHGASSFMPLYTIGNNIGWKSNDESTFGIAVNKWWNHNFAVMLIQTNISELDAGNHIATTF